jgi:hypothetical protein
VRSVLKYASGFSGITLVIPSRDRVHFEGLPVRFFEYDVIPDKGMLHHMVMVCRADETCPDADYIMHMDSDCVFIESVTPDDYFKDGKPMLMRELFSAIKTYHPGRYRWKSVTERILAFYVKYETMVRQMAVHPRHIYGEVRRHIEGVHLKPFDEFVLGCSERPLSFTEFPVLGAYALRFYPDAYYWLNAKSPVDQFSMNDRAEGVREKFKQFWSWNGVEKHIAELDEICK